MKKGKSNKIIPRLACASTIFLYPYLNGVAIDQLWLILASRNTFMMKPLHLIRLICILQEMSTLAFLHNVTSQGLR
jgi:hypothetical protein